MSKGNNTGKIILSISALALLVGGYFYFRKPSDSGKPPVNPPTDEDKTVTSTDSGNITPPPNLAPPTPTSKPVQYANVYATANNAIMYAANPLSNGLHTVGAKIRSMKKGDKVGQYAGERTIQNHKYYLVTASTGSKVLVSQMVSEIKF